ncbi:MAG: VanW family protein [Candidatus Magasanikbacteria bacterium]|nr:VanW family protein [Candidatus Magasanikbacteria bacterium]
MDSVQEILPIDLPPKRSPKHWLKKFGVFFLILFLTFGAVSGAAAFYLKFYQEKIYPGIYAGHYHLGAMTRADLNNFIETTNNRLSKEGINLDVVVGDKKSSVRLNTISSGGNAAELVKLDSYVLWQNAYTLGRSGRWPERLFGPIYYRIQNINLSVPVKVDWLNLMSALKDNLDDLVDKPRNANVEITSFEPLNYTVLSEQTGLEFEYEKIIDQIEKNLSQLYLGNINVAATQFDPAIKFADAQKASENLATIVQYGDLALNYVDPQTKVRRDWPLGIAQYVGWLEVAMDDNQQSIFILNQEKVKTYLESLRPLVDSVAQDAKFAVDESGKVKEFQASQAGLTLNTDKTYSDLNSAFKERNYHPAQVTKTVSLTVDVAEPVVKMADANNLGIEQVIGAGYSTFKDSHNNRIKNIAHAVARLNGVLIKPEEEFSAIRYAGPFTAENGYLPEAVIKGKEIKDEIGGGMCQIGTTLFRMAMNSGMEITQRQNHSLVVGYYSDPVNGNPGTDAALYEPILDLKFKNDTGHYLLLQTNIDYKKQQLTFTLWGKPDGRSGFYTHPLVKKWIPAGDPQEVKTDKLKPGEVKCQNAFRGAVASFTYTRVTGIGEKIERVFDSYYRPLPKICMIGVDPAVCKEGTVCNTPQTVNLETVESVVPIDTKVTTTTY